MVLKCCELRLFLVITGGEIKRFFFFKLWRRVLLARISSAAMLVILITEVPHLFSVLLTEDHISDLPDQVFTLNSN